MIGGAFAASLFGGTANLLAQTDPLLSGGGASSGGAGMASGGATAAATAASSAPQGAGPGWISWVMMLGVFGVFYFLVLRPQQKRASSHKQFLEALQVGSSVVTTGGIYGKVVGIEDQIVRVEVADRVQMRVHKSHVAGTAANAAEALAGQQR